MVGALIVVIVVVMLSEAPFEPANVPLAAASLVAVTSLLAQILIIN